MEATVKMGGKEYPLQRFTVKTYGPIADLLTDMADAKTNVERMALTVKFLKLVWNVDKSAAEELDLAESQAAISSLIAFNKPVPKAGSPEATDTETGKAS